MRGKKKPANKQSGSIRVISGKWRGRKLPVANSEGLRPTTDRTKETLFNWLMQDVAGSTCLDVFAGSGSLGIEALSRHARRAVMLEKEKVVAKNLQNIKCLLEQNDEQMSVVNIDALAFLQTKATEKFDVVFVDPPFHHNLLHPSVTSLIDNGWLTSGALLYIEHESDLCWSPPKGLTQVKRKSTQQVVSMLLEYQQ